jgi:hypothetical protein
MEDCLRVDAEGVELGVIDPNDPLYRDGQKVIRQTLREARRWEAHWTLKARASRAPIVHVPERREAAAPTARRRERRARRASTPSRASPGDSGPEPPLEVFPLARFRRDVRRALKLRKGETR